jgi:hypothetical protein
MNQDQITALESRLVGTSTCNLYVDPEVVRKLMAAYRAEQAATDKLKKAIRTIINARCDTVQTHVIQNVARRVLAEILGQIQAGKEGPMQRAMNHF